MTLTTHSTALARSGLHSMGAAMTTSTSTARARAGRLWAWWKCTWGMVRSGRVQGTPLLPTRPILVVGTRCRSGAAVMARVVDPVASHRGGSTSWIWWRSYVQHLPPCCLPLR
uniref:Uncharacterized protein n=1 Tax=Arundo donax TaxID=35708 RepID=A0A0A9BXT9_ARUDO